MFNPRSVHLYQYGGFSSVRLGLDQELSSCLNESERFNKTLRRFGLIYLEVPDRITNFDEHLYALPHGQKPNNVVVNAICNKNGTYTVVAIVSYERRINVTRCAYFQVGGVVPLMSREVRKIDDWFERIGEVIEASEPSTRLTSKTIRDRDMNPRNVIITTERKVNLNKNMILCGPTQSGKTSLAKILLEYRVLIVENVDRDLPKFDPSIHDGIVFENLDFRMYPHHSIANLLSRDDRKIEVKDNSIRVPASTKLIFTTRIAHGSIFPSSMKSIKSLIWKVTVRGIETQ